MNKQLHIVCFDAPSPPDYGGAIDLFYKIVALADAGVKITLHYFGYRAGRDHSALEPYCNAIHLYQRKSPQKCLLSPLPYIVASRISRQLVERINENNHPVLLEGVHCTGILPLLKQDGRKTLVRLHNNEAAYYQRLAHTEIAPLRNFYYMVESNRLERYQQKLPKHIGYAALSQTDVRVFQERYGLEQTSFVPCFVPWQQLLVKEGAGAYCLYHGNLSVPENSAVALWLVKNVFAGIDIPFVIAGKDAPGSLQKIVANNSNVQLVENPSDEVLDKLISEAQVHVLPSLNETGVKLKLLHALFCGRHCLTNAAGVAGSGLHELVHLAEDADAMKYTLQYLMQRPFTEKEMQQRRPLLHLYDNIRNADALKALIW